MKVGITCEISTLTKIWSNGLFQNLLTLHGILEKIPGIESVLVCKTINEDSEFESKILNSIGTNVVFLNNETFKSAPSFDVILEVGFALSKKDFNNARKFSPETKIVHICYGSLYFTATERMVFSDMFFDIEGKRDEVWISPHFMYSKDFISSFFETDRVKICPYVWDPTLLESDIKNTGKINSDIKNVAILEPSVNILKTPTIPAMICNEVFKKQSDLIDHCFVFGGEKLVQKTIANNIFGRLEIVKDGKLTFEKRKKFSDIFVNHCGLIVSHQHFCELNYVYLEALHLGIPLVHNSPMIKDAGYYYPDFEIKKGAKALQKAIETHESRSKEYDEISKKTVWNYSSKNPKNIKGYAHLIESLIK